MNKILYSHKDVLQAGNIVTNARGGQSFHNFGLAIDVVEMNSSGQPIWTNDRWNEIGEIGKSHGFEWGGDWANFPDRPHFQMTFGLITGQLFQRYNERRVDDDGFVLLN